MREVEVLHDALLAFFEQDPGLTPEEIVVMAPDIGRYAPFIEAVFGAPSEESRRIPFNIADCGPAGDTRAFSALGALLDLKGSRFGAAETLRLLEFPSIRGRFGIAEGELAALHAWVASCGVRWGRDAAARAALGLPAEARNTWRAGIERMLLGYAMPSDGRELYRGILPFDAVEGQQGRLLGDFIDFLEAVFALAAELDTPRSLGAWGRTLAAAVNDFIASDPAGDAEAQSLAGILAELPALEARAAFAEAVPLEVVRGLLAERLQAERIGWGFLSGGVTFCAMLPMRTIPFKIVCLIGMNHDAFPREHHPPDFDLVARHPRRGDRSRRNDDKYLFLEALLAARRTLYISYVGQGIQDNSRRPPSVLVSELLETLDTVYGVRLDPASGSRVTLHRLQAFSPDYFRPASPLFSYSRDDCLACRRAAERAPRPGFFEGRLPLDPAEEAAFREVTPERLAAFFRSPARFLLQNRLAIRLDAGAGPPEEREPFGLGALARYRLGQAILDAHRSGGEPEAVVAAFRAAGELPHGAAGDILARRLAADVERFHAALRMRLPPPAGVELDIDRSLSGFHLAGRLRGLSSEGCLSLRYADLTAADFLGHWIRHLCLCLAAGDDLVCRSLLIGKDAAWSFERIAECEPILANLLAIYRRGLEEPLPFFPALSLDYFAAAQRDPVKALAKARREWVGSDHAPGPAADPSLELCFGHGEPIDAEFAALSAAVFGPLFEHGRREPLN
jgi:exodeoxyribonuclease V gamma subunit